MLKMSESNRNIFTCRLGMWCLYHRDYDSLEDQSEVPDISKYKQAVLKVRVVAVARMTLRLRKSTGWVEFMSEIASYECVLASINNKGHGTVFFVYRTQAFVYIAVCWIYCLLMSTANIPFNIWQELTVSCDFSIKISTYVRYMTRLTGIINKNNNNRSNYLLTYQEEHPGRD